MTIQLPYEDLCLIVGMLQSKASEIGSFANHDKRYLEIAMKIADQVATKQQSLETNPSEKWMA